jgi:hypothetical protein
MEKKSSRHVIVALSVVGLLIGDVLSVGPAVAICHALESEVAWDLYTAAYEPLEYLPKPLKRPLHAWAIFCGAQLSNWLYD